MKNAILSTYPPPLPHPLAAAHPAQQAAVASEAAKRTRGPKTAPPPVCRPNCRPKRQAAARQANAGPQGIRLLKPAFVLRW